MRRPSTWPKPRLPNTTMSDPLSSAKSRMTLIGEPTFLDAVPIRPPTDFTLPTALLTYCSPWARSRALGATETPSDRSYDRPAPGATRTSGWTAWIRLTGMSNACDRRPAKSAARIEASDPSMATVIPFIGSNLQNSVLHSIAKVQLSTPHKSPTRAGRPVLVTERS